MVRAQIQSAQIQSAQIQSAQIQSFEVRPDGGAAPPLSSGDIAVCMLTEHGLAADLAGGDRLAVVAPLATANLGIEQLVLGVIGMPALRHLVICGRDSPVFRSGQSLLALAAHGCHPDGTIIGATGYRPKLATLRPAVVAAFRRRIAVHDLIGVRDPPAIAAAAARLPRADTEPVSLRSAATLAAEVAASGVVLRPLAAGGNRIPIADADGSFFVITTESRRIVVRHYQADLAAGHEMTGKSAQALLLGLVREGLLADPAHAGYLGAELAKAETALRLGLVYRQDHPLG
jgi:hypothetical protein